MNEPRYNPALHRLEEAGASEVDQRHSGRAHKVRVKAQAPLHPHGTVREDWRLFVLRTPDWWLGVASLVAQTARPAAWATGSRTNVPLLEPRSAT